MIGAGAAQPGAGTTLSTPNVVRLRPPKVVTPFATIAAAVLANGYHPIPIMPGSKSPGTLTSGKWHPMDNWPIYRDMAPVPWSMTLWSSHEDAGIGVVLGTDVTPGWELGAVDFDTDDVMMLEILESSLPESPVKKRGRRGFTAFYLFPKGTKGRRFRRNLATVCELLTGNGCRQTVIPPSIHPDTREPYQWLTKKTLATLAPIHLPRITEEMLERFVDAAGGFEDVVEAAGPAFVANENGSPHRKLNDAALANLDKWVPDLQLYKCRRNGSGYRAVASWRVTGNIENWDTNLSINKEGIRDFGDDRGYTPLDLIMTHQNWALDHTFEWLSARLGMFQSGNTYTFERAIAKQMREKAEAVALSGPLGSIMPTLDTIDPLPPHDPETGEILCEAPQPASSLVENPNADLTQVPGLLGEMVEWIVATARQPNRVLALGAAVSVLGTLVGQYIAGPTKAGTHLYIIALAPSGAGKEHNLSMIWRLVEAAGAEVRFGAGQFMSMTAVFQLLQKQPACICPIDEIGAFLKRLAHPRASSHEQNITATLRQAWSKNFEPLPTPEWASSTHRTPMPKQIENPALSIYGCSTPGEFFDALKSKDATNGFLNRFLLLSTEVNMEDGEPEKDKRKMPDALRNKLQDLFRRGQVPSRIDSTTAQLADILNLQPEQMLWAVNAGVISGRRGGPKAGQWIGHADMERAPIGALSMSA